MHKVVAYSYTRDQAYPYYELPGSLFANNVCHMVDFRQILKLIVPS